jgi:hypothetical protein
VLGLIGVYRRSSAAEKNKAEGRRMKAEGFVSSIRVYLRLSAVPLLFFFAALRLCVELLT